MSSGKTDMLTCLDFALVTKRAPEAAFAQCIIFCYINVDVVTFFSGSTGNCDESTLFAQYITLILLIWLFFGSSIFHSFHIHNLKKNILITNFYIFGNAEFMEQDLSERQLWYSRGIEMPCVWQVAAAGERHWKRSRHKKHIVKPIDRRRRPKTRRPPETTRASIEDNAPSTKEILFCFSSTKKNTKKNESSTFYCKRVPSSNYFPETTNLLIDLQIHRIILFLSKVHNIKGNYRWWRIF